MLNFRNTTVVVAVIALVIIVLMQFRPVPFYTFGILLAGYSLVLFWGSYRVNSGFYMPVICSGNPQKKEVAISFDDGPAGEYTPEILKILAEQDVKVTFFCIGKKVSGNEGLLEQIHAGGHIIGNHSYSHHFWFDLFSSKKMLADLEQADIAVSSATGLRPKFFRPPYGITNPNLRKAVMRGGYTSVGWNVRSLDTMISDEKKLLHRVATAIRPGAVFLFHDTCLSTLKILPAFINELKQKGYKIVRLDEMLNQKPYV